MTKFLDAIIVLIILLIGVLLALMFTSPKEAGGDEIRYTPAPCNYYTETAISRVPTRCFDFFLASR